MLQSLQDSEISWKNSCASFNPDPQRPVLGGAESPGQLGSSTWSLCFPKAVLPPWATQMRTPSCRGWQPVRYLGVESVLEDFAQRFCIDLRLPCFRGVQDGRFDPLGHGLSHQLG